MPLGHRTQVGSRNFRTCRCPLEIHSFTEPSGPKPGPQPRFLGMPSAPHSFLQVHGCWSSHRGPKLMSIVVPARFPSLGLLDGHTQQFLDNGIQTPQLEPEGKEETALEGGRRMVAAGSCVTLTSHTASLSFSFLNCKREIMRLYSKS